MPEKLPEINKETLKKLQEALRKPKEKNKAIEVIKKRFGADKVIVEKNKGSGDTPKPPEAF